jgi:hypothetical protein
MKPWNPHITTLPVERFYGGNLGWYTEGNGGHKDEDTVHKATFSQRKHKIKDIFNRSTQVLPLCGSVMKI